jgi:hypothetical protein
MAIRSSRAMAHAGVLSLPTALALVVPELARELADLPS